MASMDMDSANEMSSLIGSAHTETGGCDLVLLLRRWYAGNTYQIWIKNTKKIFNSKNIYTVI